MVRNKRESGDSPEEVVTVYGKEERVKEHNWAGKANFRVDTLAISGSRLCFLFCQPPHKIYTCDPVDV
jgi:hypothetical protein